MKQLFICIVFVALASSIMAEEPVREESLSQDRNYRAEAMEILKTGNKAFKPAQSENLKDIVFHLSATDREDLFAHFQKGSLGAIALNWIPGFGAGSFGQGDKLGGTVIVVADICTTGALVVGSGYLLAGLVAVIFEAPFSSLTDGETKETDRLMKTAGISFAIGGALWLCTRIFGTVRPLVYKKSYNKKLRAALELDKPLTVTPVADVAHARFGFAASVWL